ncbi:MAG: IS1595 family transposase [Proteobacteria bacterium]|nr:IS1595 family transposase [Pseudomonadota bacterium]
MDIIEIFELYPSQADCIAHLENVRWHGNPRCVYCQSTNVTPAPKEKRHHCNNCNTTFSVTVGTIFHHTHLPMQKWFLAVTLVLNAKKGLSSRQLARDLKVNKDTAWRMGMRIREAMSEHKQRIILTGIVEVDETYIGGKPRKGDPNKSKRGRGTKKTPVVGMVERQGRITAKVVKKTELTSKKLSALVRKNVDITNATLITDEYKGYIGIQKFMAHKTVNHTVWYVNGDAHTNTIESFWALLKRGIVGQYHKVSLHHLAKYIDEFSYRWNYRQHANLFGYTIQRGLEVR